MTLAWTWEEQNANRTETGPITARTQPILSSVDTLRPQTDDVTTLRPGPLVDRGLAFDETLTSTDTSPPVDEPIPLSVRKFAEDSILPPPMRRSSPTMWLTALAVVSAVVAAVMM